MADVMSACDSYEDQLQIDRAQVMNPRYDRIAS